jgi:hypothetical protein
MGTSQSKAIAANRLIELHTIIDTKYDGVFDDERHLFGFGSSTEKHKEFVKILDEIHDLENELMYD